MIDPSIRKEIVKNLHSAIDSEMLNEDERAYQYYIESLLLVVDALKKDTDFRDLSIKDKCHLIEFAKQSVGRVSLLLKKGEPPPPEPEESNEDLLPSAPPPSDIEINVKEQTLRYTPYNANDQEEQMIMARYHRRYGLANSTLEKQNLELELARQLVEKAAITRNRLMQATAWAMQSAHRKFRIQEKLQAGRLTESDFKMQQLYALSLQFNQGNAWLTQTSHDLMLCPNNTKLVREVLDNVLTDNAHPIRATMNQMQDKVNQMITKSMNRAKSQHQDIANDVKNVEEVIKVDLHIILEVLKALFEPLNTERNCYLTSEILYHVYFSQLKQNIVILLRISLKDVEERLNERIKGGVLGSDSDDGGPYEMSENCKEAVTKFHYLTTLHNPYDMLDCTVHIIKLLASSNFDKHHCTSIGADDLLPRLCRVLLSSSLPNICAEAAFMETFMPSEKALGEEGYALTMLQSAIAHLTSDSF